MNKVEIFLAGQGGQGVLDLGNFLAFNWLLKNYHVVYTPSYGPETRGGKVRCFVVISKEDIDSPIILHPDVMIVMNIPSMDFVPLIKKGGFLIYNTSLISIKPDRADITVLPVPATDIADELKNSLSSEVLGSIKDTKLTQNAVMLGAFMAITGNSLVNMHEVLSHFYTGNRAKFIPANEKAVEAGADYVMKGSFNRWNLSL